MPSWIVGLNMLYLTIPILVGCVCLGAVLAYKDWRKGRWR